MYSYELQESSTEPPDSTPPDDMGDGLPDAPDSGAEPEPDPCVSLNIGEAANARGGCPPFPAGTLALDPLRMLPPSRLWGSSSASAASKNAAAWGWLWRSAVAWAVRP